jgi:two-component system, NarL family, invasion response regulator UvrY
VDFKILIIDDHAIVSRGLEFIIHNNFKNAVIINDNSIRGMFDILEKNKGITHLILDLNLIDGNSLDYMHKLTEQYPELPILIHSMASEEIYSKILLQFNISGYLSKSSNEEEITTALKVFLSGNLYFSKKVRKLLFANNKDVPDGKKLTKQLSVMELRVLEHILKCESSKEIANHLNIAKQTVATYKNRIFAKLGTSNIFEIKKLTDLNNI